MLILTRKIGESIIIGNDINIVILAIRGGQVKIGISAPKEISVHRDEIYRRIHDNIPLLKLNDDLDKNTNK